MPTRPKGVVSYNSADLAADQAAEVAFLDNVTNGIVSRVSSPPRRDVISVQPYDSKIGPDSTRSGN